jgi:hypothetical protein
MFHLSSSRIKFSIPALTASTALALCIFLIADCKASINVSSEWLGLFSHSRDEADSCMTYAKDPLELLKDPQLPTAQVSSVIVVLLGFPLWLSLMLSPFWKFPNGVWPKIISIAISVVIGNLQLLTVVKFIRFVLDAYPEQKVYYNNKGIIVCTVLFWFLTAIAISLCGVKPASVPLAANRQGSSRSKQGGELSKSVSEDTKETIGHGPTDLCKSASDETKDTNDLEEGILKIKNSTCEENQELEEAIEFSLSASGMGTFSSF